MSLPMRAIAAVVLGSLLLGHTTPLMASPQTDPPPEQQAPRVAGPEGPEAARQRLDMFRRQTRSTTAALLMSVPVPGWGQLYSDSPFWAAIAFGVQMFYLGNIVLETRRQARQISARDAEVEGSSAHELRNFFVSEHGERARDYAWWALGGWLLVSLDAYVSIQLSDFDDPGSAVPDLDRDWGDKEGSGGGDGAGLALGLNWRF